MSAHSWSAGMLVVITPVRKAETRALSGPEPPAASRAKISEDAPPALPPREYRASWDELGSAPPIEGSAEFRAGMSLGAITGESVESP